MVVITRGEEYAFALTHTDDVDLVGTSDEFLKGIHAKLNNEWECKITDPSFMLGVERNIVKDDDEGMTVELKMTAFVEAMAEHWQLLRRRMRQAGLPALGKLPSKNVRRAGESDLTDHFGDENLISLARERYREDVELFYGDHDLYKLARGQLSVTPTPLERITATLPA